MVLVIAHRGFSGKYPENTLLSIRKAVELGVDWIEIDVRLTRDNHLVVIHDSNLNRTTTGKGRVFLRTLEEIKKFRIKKTRQHIPILEEVLPLIKGNTKLNIEIKSVMPAIEVSRFIKKYKIEKKVVVSSGSILILKIIKQMIPSLKTAFVFYVSNYPKKDPFISLISKIFFRLTRFLILSLARSVNVDYVNLHYVFATKGFIKKLQKRGHKVNIWNVNTKALMKKMIKRKVDGIFTNRPDKLKKILKKKK